jgi:hypothetical protein
VVRDQTDAGVVADGAARRAATTDPLRTRRGARARNDRLISTVCLCARRWLRPRASQRRDALGEPSVSAGADDRFAQFDVVGLTIALATKRSSAPTVCRSLRPCAGRGEATAAVVHHSATALGSSQKDGAVAAAVLLGHLEAGARPRPAETIEDRRGCRANPRRAPVEQCRGRNELAWV